MIDATHTRRWEREKWTKTEQFDCYFLCVHAKPEVCIQRAKAAGQTDLIDVIRPRPTGLSMMRFQMTGDWMLTILERQEQKRQNLS
ncbi:hypothetical protein U2F10_35395 [Leptothoe sp. EHU-05/26/07-4]